MTGRGLPLQRATALRYLECVPVGASWHGVTLPFLPIAAAALQLRTGHQNGEGADMAAAVPGAPASTATRKVTASAGIPRPSIGVAGAYGSCRASAML